MNIKHFKFLKDERKPIVREWTNNLRSGVSHHSQVEYKTYYTSCYVADVDLQTYGINEKAILSLLDRKKKEMNGDGIVGYFEAVMLNKITSFLKDFKPFHKDISNTEKTQGTKDGVPCEFYKHTRELVTMSIQIAYKVNGTYEYIDISPLFNDDTTIEEWNKLSSKDKFYCYGQFMRLGDEIWKILYRLKGKGLIAERYKKGSVGKNSRGRFYGVKAKRFYSITESGIEYLKGI